MNNKENTSLIPSAGGQEETKDAAFPLCVVLMIVCVK